MLGSTWKNGISMRKTLPSIWLKKTLIIRLLTRKSQSLCGKQSSGGQGEIQHPQEEKKMIVTSEGWVYLRPTMCHQPIDGEINEEEGTQTKSKACWKLQDQSAHLSLLNQVWTTVRWRLFLLKTPRSQSTLKSSLTANRWKGRRRRQLL